MKNYLVFALILITFCTSKAQTITTVAGGNGGGNAADQLSDPAGVYMDKNGNLYVADETNARIQKFPPGSTSATNGATVAGGNGNGSGADQLDAPRSVFVDDSGNIYVADQNNHRIQKFPAASTSATSGITIAGGNGAGGGANQFTPGALFVDDTGNLYVTDNTNDRVLKFPAGSDSSTNGVTVAGGNGAGSAADQLGNPSGVFVDRNGNIYVADELNNRIQKFPPGSNASTPGVTIAGTGTGGTTANEFEYPSQLFIDVYGYLYVSDNENVRVQKFPPNTTSGTNGVTVAGGNGIGSAADQLQYPNGLYVDDSGNIYVADLINDRVQKWSQNIVIPTITTGTVSNSSFCAGSTANVPYTLTGSFNSDNVFTVQLSDSSGGFTHAVNIGTLASDTNGTIAITIPANAIAGTAYRIRVVSSDPPVTGTDNGINLTITVLLPPTLSMSGNLCSGHDTLIVTGVTGATRINWYISDSLFDTGTALLYIPADTGNYYVTYIGPGGCVSRTSDTVHIRFGSDNDTVNQTICNGQSYDGHTANGTYMDTFTLSGGCDSIRLLYLAVLPTASSRIDMQICIGDSFQGHSSAGTFMDTFSTSNGCDSIVTLNLSFFPIATSNIAHTICFGQSYLGHDSTGIYTDTLFFASANGCDSIRVLNLTVNSLLSTINKQRICLGDTFEGHTIPGNYTDTFTSAGGCDSFVTLELQVDTLPASISISQTGDTLFTTPGFTTYKWYFDSLIQIDDSTYLVDTIVLVSNSNNTFIISRSGYYQVEASNGNACFVNSDIVIAYLTGIENVKDGQPSLSIYPNPASNLVNITLSGLQSNQALSMKVYNIIGQKVSEVSQTPSGKSYNTQLDVSTFAKGIYLLSVQQGDWELTQRVVVE